MILNFALATLAIIALAQLVTKERGAFGMFERLRTVFPLGGLLDCPYCLMVWLAVPALVWVFNANDLPLWITALVMWLALIGAAYCVRRYSGLDYK